MVALGSKVQIVGGDLYLGKRIPAGTVGVVVGRKHGDYGHLYLVEIEHEIYTLAPAEFQVFQEDTKDE